MGLWHIDSTAAVPLGHSSFLPLNHNKPVIKPARSPAVGRPPRLDDAVVVYQTTTPQGPIIVDITMHREALRRLPAARNLRETGTLWVRILTPRKGHSGVNGEGCECRIRSSAQDERSQRMRCPSGSPSGSGADSDGYRSMRRLLVRSDLLISRVWWSLFRVQHELGRQQAFRGRAAKRCLDQRRMVR